MNRHRLFLFSFVIFTLCFSKSAHGWFFDPPWETIRSIIKSNGTVSGYVNTVSPNGSEDSVHIKIIFEYMEKDGKNYSTDDLINFRGMLIVPSEGVTHSIKGHLRFSDEYRLFIVDRGPDPDRHIDRQYLLCPTKNGPKAYEGVDGQQLLKMTLFLK